PRSVLLPRAGRSVAPACHRHAAARGAARRRRGRIAPAGELGLLPTRASRRPGLPRGAAGAGPRFRRARDAPARRGEAPAQPRPGSVPRPVTLSRRAAAEFVGTALLLATVVGSGIMAERLAGGNAALALLANTLATGAGLVALILAFGPISGAHFNPAVALA